MKSCGIYKLVFKNTDKVYIGQSLNIQRRYSEHLYSLLHKTASGKLKEAHNLFGLPDLEILSECSLEELDIQEQECIEIYDSIENGFNSIHKTDRIVGLQGHNHGSCIHSKEELIAIMINLIEYPDLSYKQISKKLNVSFNTVAQIAGLRSHSWLNNDYPEIYAKLVNLKNTRNRIGSNTQDKRSCLATTGKIYKLLSPKKEVYSITNVRAFCRDNNLHNGCIFEVLSGKRYTHKGWSLCPDEHL